MSKYVFGVDIGGTTVKLGFFTVEGELLDKWEIPTRKDEGGRFILPDVAASIEAKLAEKNVEKEENIQVQVGSVTNTNTIHESVLSSAFDDPGAEELPDMFVSYPKTVLAMPDDSVLVDYRDYFTSVYMPDCYCNRLFHCPPATSGYPHNNKKSQKAIS